MSSIIKPADTLLPICAACKKVCDEAGQWHELDLHIHRSLEAHVTHTICPACAQKLYPDFHQQMYEKMSEYTVDSHQCLESSASSVQIASV